MGPLVSCGFTKQKRCELERQKPILTQLAATELLLIRHAPSQTGGRLAGRSDVPADCSDARALAELRAAIGRVEHRVMSPARRCMETAAALWPDMTAPEIDARLWEQDFGDWEGLATADLPDFGSLSPDALAILRPPRGESFSDLCDRAAPTLEALAARGGRVAVVAHGGLVRAVLALALGTRNGALAFQVAPLSLTRLTRFHGMGWSVDCVNWTVTDSGPTRHKLAPGGNAT